jgi:hypothetical protein
MRSHSRVDLYAKAVALTGLGCLGIGGALVDYWPTTSDLPAVRSATEFAGSPSVSTIVDVPGFTSASSAGIRFILGSARDVRTAQVTTKSVEPVTSEIQPISFSPVPRSLTVDATVRLADLPGQPVNLSHAPLIDEPVFTEETPSPAAVMVLNNSEPDGFLSGVLKKTRASVGSSVGKAGSSLAGAVRVVGGAVRKGSEALGF